MADRISCPSCEAVRDVEVVERDEKVTIKGREVPFRARFSRCTLCGKEFETPERLDANLLAAREAYAHLYEAPTPAQLVSLRSRYGASQKAFGLILGFGELTMNSYEKGASPDSTNRLLLRLAENPVIFRAMYELNRDRIGAIQRQRIESSQGYRSAASWAGMEALAGALTPVQRAKIELCAAGSYKTVLERVIAYVSPASFEDYSKLVLGAKWSTGHTSTLSQRLGEHYLGPAGEAS